MEFFLFFVKILAGFELNSKCRGLYKSFPLKVPRLTKYSDRSSHVNGAKMADILQTDQSTVCLTEVNKN